MLVPDEPCCCIASMSVCADMTLWPAAAHVEAQSAAIVVARNNVRRNNMVLIRRTQRVAVTNSTLNTVLIF
jgi:hypothetical protein